MNRKETKSSMSYDAHEIHHQENFQITNGEDYLFSLKNKDCVAYKIALRSLDIIKPLLKEKNRWLTIGDFTGFEAKYLIEQNQDVTASDLSDVFLKEAHKQKLIEKYAKINVEQIEIEEDGFDYLFCKQ